MVDQFKEWRGFTPILLVVILVLGWVVSFLIIDKVNAISDGIKDVKQSFGDFKIDSSAHFAKIDQELVDFKPR